MPRKNRPVRDGGASALLENIEIDGEVTGVVPKGVSKGVPAGNRDENGCPARVGWSVRTWAGVFRKGSGPGGIGAGVHEETAAGWIRSRVEDVVLKKVPGVVINR